MKVVLVSCVFPPEHTYSAQTGAQIAEELARRGHSVHVCAPFSSQPVDRLFDGYKRILYSASTAGNGYTLVATPASSTINSKILKYYLPK
jgi:hypothetical protein